jgi:hypothetical protein
MLRHGFHPTPGKNFYELLDELSAQFLEEYREIDARGESWKSEG